MRWRKGKGSPTPVNKGHGRGRRGRLPQIDNPVLISVLTAGARGVSAALDVLKPPKRAGRGHRVQQWLTERMPDMMGAHLSLDVRVHEGFGRSPLIDMRIVCDDDSEDQARQQLEDAVRCAWDNPELAPVAVRACVTDSAGEVRCDVTSVGFSEETATPSALYARFGAPDADPAWRP